MPLAGLLAKVRARRGGGYGADSFAYPAVAHEPVIAPARAPPPLPTPNGAPHLELIRFVCGSSGALRMEEAGVDAVVELLRGIEGCAAAAETAAARQLSGAALLHLCQRA